MPLNFLITNLTKIGDQPFSIGGSVPYWADAPDSGPEGWGACAVVTYLFPTGSYTLLDRRLLV